MNRDKSSLLALLAEAILGTIIAVAIAPTTMKSSQEQGKRAAEAIAFLTSPYRFVR
jgi:hypothetical protein